MLRPWNALVDPPGAPGSPFWLVLLLVIGSGCAAPAATKPCGWYFSGSRAGVGWLRGVWTGAEVDSPRYIEWIWMPLQGGTMAGVLRETPSGTGAPKETLATRLTVIREQAGGVVLEEDGRALRLVESSEGRAVFAGAHTKLTVRFVPDGSGLLVWTREEEGAAPREWRLYREL